MRKSLNVLFIIFIMFAFLPFVVNAKEYYLGNIKIGQRFETGDTIYHVIQRGEFLEDPDTLNNLIANESYPHLLGTDIFGRMYGINFVIDDTVNPCSGSCQSFSFSQFADEKEYYWTLENYEEISTLEAAAVYFKTHEKKPIISIINYINDSDKYFAKKDEILKYSIKIKNTGSGKSTDNIIITNVPDGLLILENQIGSNGIYNKENNTITWNYDLLKAEEEYTFYYYAKVIDNNITEYIGNSYITSSQVQKKIESTDTIVNIENRIKVPDTIKNPNTGTGISIIILSLILVTCSITYILLKRKENHIIK